MPVDAPTIPYNRITDHMWITIPAINIKPLYSKMIQPYPDDPSHAKIIGAISIHSICSYYGITTLCYNRNIIEDLNKVNHFQFQHPDFVKVFYFCIYTYEKPRWIDPLSYICNQKPMHEAKVIT